MRTLKRVCNPLELLRYPCSHVAKLLQNTEQRVSFANCLDTTLCKHLHPVCDLMIAIPWHGFIAATYLMLHTIFCFTLQPSTLGMGRPSRCFSSLQVVQLEVYKVAHCTVLAS